ncbi:hypothetical protein BUMB_00478c [Candidatus Paraburkholderia calva]|nr:hypothetical protein BUMB_00478c [Candidatus Paraburkholderia calva]
MNNPHISVDTHGNAVTSHAAPIGEHVRGRARLLSSLVNMVCTPGVFAHFTDDVRHDVLLLMQALASEQLSLIDALEKHTAQTYYERGAQAALEHRERQEKTAEAQPHLETQGEQQLDYTQR